MSWAEEEEGISISINWRNGKGMMSEKQVVPH
jgi:hypothetical protein